MKATRFALAAAAGLALAGLLAFTLLSSAPDPASANPATGFVSISSGEAHTCALTTGGGVKCWGRNIYGQLGDGGACGALCTTPTQVTGLTSGVASVVAGANHTCVAMTNGAAKCWGRNLYGALGDGTTTQRSTPVAVSTLSSGVMAITTGDWHSCALLGAGTIRCWGRNYDGAVGDGSTTDRLTPVAVTGIASGATSIDAGGDHSCAIVSSAAKCWGRNAAGQLGNGTTTSSSSPVDVSSLTDVMQLAAGFNFTCATTGGGGVKCWGSNVGGQLGDGRGC
jgi:alpha-tubulin suppressor-like RCC1 family protein